MKWIVVVIAVFIVGYTAVNLYFRKPGKAYRPYQDAQDRATTARLLAAGWHKLPLDTRRPAEKPSTDDASPAAITRGAVGLGLDMAPNFAEKPKLLDSIDRVTAPSSVVHGQDYSLYFTGSLADQKAQLGEMALYHRGNELVIIPGTEKLPGKELMSRWNDANYAVTFSTSALAPGRYAARIVAQGPAATWSFTVK
jgi:hypothetical protein